MKDLHRVYYGYYPGFFGDINPHINGWDYCFVYYDEFASSNATEFLSNYPGIINSIFNYKFNDIVYTTAEDLYAYLSGQTGNTISLKVYDSSQA